MKKPKETLKEFKKWLVSQIQLGEKSRKVMTDKMQRTLKKDEVSFWEYNLIIHNSNLDLLKKVKAQLEAMEKQYESSYNTEKNEKVN